MDYKPMATPMHPNCNLDSNDSSGMVDSKVYGGMVDFLLYLTASRSDTLFSVCLCARFRSYPRESHFTVLKRIVKHLKGSNNLCLLYKKSSEYKLGGFCDADYDIDRVERKITSGCCQFIG